MKNKNNYEFYLRRFQEVVCFLTVVRIKKHFNTVDKYINSENSSKAYYLSIKYDVLARLSRLPHGIRCFEQFLKDSGSMFIYHRHCHKTNKKKNKKFARNSWFELSESELARWFEDEKNFNTKTCKLISNETHKWIDNYIYYTVDVQIKKLNNDYKEKYYAILHNEIEKDNKMTKAEKEIIIKKYANNEGAFESAEDEIKRLTKIEKQKIRAQERRIKKVALKTLIEEQIKIKKLEAKIDQLEAENQHFKQLKDLNSDIDEESQSDLEQKEADFEEAVKKGASQLPAECRSDNSDIPDFEEDSEEAEEAEFKPCSSAEFRRKLTAYEDKKEEEQEEALAVRRNACQHPEDDIPEDDIPQVDESQLLTQDKLQLMVDKQLVSKTFAQAIWKTVSGKEVCFKDSRNGWSVNDTQKKWKNEYNVIQIVLDNISYYQLSSDDVAHWQKRQRILKQNAVSSL